MADYSQMSDADLTALVQPRPSDYSKMSDADLMKAVAPKETFRGTILPIAIDEAGKTSLAVPKALQGVGEFISGLPSLPQRSLQASENLRQGGEYDPAPAMEAATLASPLSVSARAGEKIIPGVTKNVARVEPAAPTATRLAKEGGADIQAAKQSGLEVASGAAGDWSTKFQRQLFEQGITPVDAPATYAKLQQLQSAPAGSSFTATNIQSFRASLGHTAQNFNPQAAKDQLAASLAIKDFDQLLPNVAPKDVLAGAPAATQSLFERGRGNYAAAQRSNDITGELDKARTGLVERAEGRAQAANSGRNFDNTLRSKVESVLEKPKEVSGLSDAEIARLGDFVQGGAGRNTARYVGNALGGGGGIGQSWTAAVGGAGGAAVGSTLGHPLEGAAVGAAIPAGVGAIAKALQNSISRREIAHIDELLRRRSPLYEELLRNADTFAPGVEKKAALVKALLSTQSQ